MFSDIIPAVSKSVKSVKSVESVSSLNYKNYRFLFFLRKTGIVLDQASPEGEGVSGEAGFLWVFSLIDPQEVINFCFLMKNKNLLNYPEKKRIILLVINLIVCAGVVQWQNISFPS